MHLPPNERACGRWLRNRRPDKWNVRRRVEAKPAEALPKEIVLGATLVELLRRGMLVYIGGTPAAETPSMHDEQGHRHAGEQGAAGAAQDPFAHARMAV